MNSGNDLGFLEIPAILREICGEKTATFAKKLANFLKNAKFDENFEIRERCKGVHCVDLGESFPTSIYLQNLVSIQLKTSPKTSKCYFRITQRFNFPMVFSPERSFAARVRVRAARVRRGAGSPRAWRSSSTTTSATRTCARMLSSGTSLAAAI